jgi:hypothetical protein
MPRTAAEPMCKLPGGWALYDRMRNQIQASETEC